jgi:hypothetical protein
MNKLVVVFYILTCSIMYNNLLPLLLNVHLFIVLKVKVRFIVLFL